MSAVSISTTTAVHNEGDSGAATFVFTLTRSGDTALAGTVDFSVSGLATSGFAAEADDFVGGSLPAGTVTFAAGERSATLEIAVAGDLVGEADEGFLVSLSNPSEGLVLGASAAIGVIRSDDLIFPQFERDPASAPFGLSGARSGLFADIDNDGDLDALFGNDSGSYVFFRNTGTVDAPDYVVEGGNNPFGLPTLRGQTLPELVDIDGDGDLDAFVGFSPEFEPGFTGLRFFRNVGSQASPSFVATGGTTPFGITFAGSRPDPTFVDIDGDGDLDLFANRLFFENTGSANAPSFAAGVNASSMGLPTINRAQTDFVDLDGDGDYDVVIGDLFGEVNVFLNVGDATNPSFAELDTANPFGISDIGSEADPNFLDVDGDGDLDALVTNSTGGVVLFRNVAAVVDETFTAAALVADAAEGDDGSTAFTFVVTRTDGIGEAATIGFAVSGGFDVTGADFAGGELPQGTLDFAAGETQKTVTIEVAGDRAIEGDEAFTVLFSRQSDDGPDETVTTTGVIRADDSTDLIVFLEDVTDSPIGSRTYSFNRVNPALADIDGDGDLDLFIMTTHGVRLLRNEGTAFAPQFVNGVVAFGLDPNTGRDAALAFGDLDGDGDLDAVLGAMRVYENIGDSTTPSFVRKGPDTFGLEDPGSRAVPALVDIDHDGDLDLFYGDENGEFGFFRNIGDAQTPWFQREGGEAPFGLINLGTDATIQFADLDGDGDFDAIAGNDEGNVLFRNIGDDSLPEFVVDEGIAIPDGYNTVIALGDIDSDGDIDMVLETTRAQLSLFRNLANPTGLSLVVDQELVLEPDAGELGIVVTVTRGYDLDTALAVDYQIVLNDILSQEDFADGFMLSGQIAFEVGEIQATLIVPLRGDVIPEFSSSFEVVVSDPAAPDDLFSVIAVSVEDDDPRTVFSFAQEGGNFPFGFTDVGDALAPAFVDIDGDGDLDAFIGEAAGTLNFFRNIGTAFDPQFQQEGGYYPLGFIDTGTTANPAFVDIDGDGDLDAYVGQGWDFGYSTAGKTSFFRNVGTATDPAFVLETGVDAQISFDAGDFAAPAFGDIDGDGDFDAIFGAANGDLFLKINTGTSTDPNFTSAAIKRPFGLKDLGSYAMPSLLDIDGDLDLDLVVNLYDGTTRIFENIGTEFSPTFTTAVNMSTFGIPKLHALNATAFADIDGDGDMDAFLATNSGIYFYRQESFIPIGGKDDTILGGAGDDSLDGSDLDDYIAGLDGADLLLGGVGDDAIDGGKGNDSLEGGEGNDLLLGGVGDDTLLGGLGDDILEADAGNDSLLGGDGDDRIDGGDGSDYMAGEAGNDLLVGGAGNDGINGGEGDDSLDGGEGADLLLGMAGNDHIDGGEGDDGLNGGDGDDIVLGGIGIDLLLGEAGNDMLDGGAGNDDLNGGAGDDIILAGEGDDLLLGEGGDDDLSGGAGNDGLNGGEGNDTLGGGAGQDLLVGEAGDDTLHGDADDDTLRGGLGNDALDGGSGNDDLSGNDGNDALLGGVGNDALDGGSGDDTLAGDAGDDVLVGDTGNDALDGGSGNDSLSGNDGNDALLGGVGNDVLDGGIGDDTLAGDDGDDVLVGDTGNDALDGGNGNDDLSGNDGNDALLGGGGNDALDGGIGDDTLAGDDGDDVLAGDLGNDVLDGGGGNDTLNGADGEDTLGGGLGNDALDGGVGNDVLDGGDGDDVVVGGLGDDRLRGGQGSDHLTGGDGSDRLWGGDGDDTLLGGDGSDWADYGVDDQAKVVQLRHGFGRDRSGSDGQDTLQDIENVIGSAHDDVIVGNNDANTLLGGGGNDVLTGLQGDDVLEGGAGNDRLRGQADNDTLLGGAGDDTLEGEIGDDILDGGAGNDTLLGGRGSDWVDYGLDEQAKNVQLRYGYGRDRSGDNEHDTLEEIENVIGSAHDDVIVGSDDGNTLRGGDGDDVLTGLQGDDVLEGGAGADRLRGQADNDTLLGGAGNDTLEGATGDDVLNGGAGNDTLLGGDGSDWVDYGLDDQAKNVQLRFGTGTDRDAGGDDDTLVEVENVVGSAHDDVLTGNNDANTLLGGEGDDVLTGLQGDDVLEGGAGNDFLRGQADNDTLSGGAGDDTLDAAIGDDMLAGGAGNDLLDGGGGNDVFVFADGDGQDTIGDFEVGIDRIDLSAVSAITDFADLMANHVSETGGDVLIEDSNGASIQLVGVGIADLSEGDFLL